MSNLTLYEISENLTALIDSLDLCETEELRAQCERDIEQAVALQVKKVDDFCRFCAHLDSQVELAEHEIERLKARKETLTHAAQRLEGYAIRVMQAQNVTRLEGETSKMYLRKNAPAVEIVDQDAVPAEFKTIVQKINIDKRAIKRALDGGGDVPGVDLRYGSVSLIRK